MYGQLDIDVSRHLNRKFSEINFNRFSNKVCIHNYQLESDGDQNYFLFFNATLILCGIRNLLNIDNHVNLNFDKHLLLKMTYKPIKLATTKQPLYKITTSTIKENKRLKTSTVFILC